MTNFQPGTYLAPFIAMQYLLGLFILLGSFNLYSKEVFWNFKKSPSYQSIDLEKALKIKTSTPKKKITVAIIDTGIDPHHPLFANSLSSNYGFDFSEQKVLKNPMDNHGHGTHVAGIIKTIAPEVNLMVLKYYNPKKSGFENLQSTIKSLEYAINQNVDIINYSGGGPEASKEEELLLKKAQEKGIIVIAAAGNEASNIDGSSPSQKYFPANYQLPNIIVVNSHDKNKKVVKSSNWGKNSVDIAAPGFRIKSSFPGKKVALMTGTSQATAFVSGVAALIKSHYPHLKASQIKEAILSGAIKSSYLANKNLSEGYLNAVSALKNAERIHLKVSRTKRSLARK